MSVVPGCSTLLGISSLPLLRFSPNLQIQAHYLAPDLSVKIPRGESSSPRCCVLLMSSALREFFAVSAEFKTLHKNQPENSKRALGMVVMMWRLGDVCREGGKPPYLPTRENLMFVSWLVVEKERKQETCTSLSSLCSLFNFQTAHGMVLVMLRLGGCVQGRGVTPLPADKRKLGGDCLGGCGERQKTRTHNQHFSLFVSKSHNSHPLSLQLQQLFSCSSSVVSLLWGDGGRAQKKSLVFPKNLFHFASHCSLLVSMECALHICSLACSHCTFVPHVIDMKRERKGGIVARTLTSFTSFTHFTRP